MAKKNVKETKDRPRSQKWKKYTIEGDKVKAAKSCPKCGRGVFMAAHKDRDACGKCGYTERKKKSE